MAAGIAHGHSQDVTKQNPMSFFGIPHMTRI
jgi:hypothetical protein